MIRSIDKSKLCFKIINERKAIDAVLLQVGEMTTISDYFIIASGNSTRQVQAIARHLSRRMREEGCKLSGTEGEQEGNWILMDYGDVIVHIFYQPFRELYDLESLWIEAPRIAVQEQQGDALP